MDFKIADEQRKKGAVCKISHGFPRKLYDVADDGQLVRWNSAGTSVLVDAKDFENQIMKLYPSFVRNPSFLNIRRLFRDYGFDWRNIEGTENLYEFTHPAFIRGRCDLLCDVKMRPRRRGITTKRKHDDEEEDSSERNEQPYFTRGERKTDGEITTLSYGFPDFAPTCMSRSSIEDSDQSSTQSTSTLLRFQTTQVRSKHNETETYSSTSVQRAVNQRAESRSGHSAIIETKVRSMLSDGLLDILAVFAENELNEEERLQLLENITVHEHLQDHNTQHCQPKMIPTNNVRKKIDASFHQSRWRQNGAIDVGVTGNKAPCTVSLSAPGYSPLVCNNIDDRLQFESFGGGYCPTPDTETSTSGFNSATDSDSLSEDTGPAAPDPTQNDHNARLDIPHTRQPQSVAHDKANMTACYSLTTASTPQTWDCSQAEFRKFLAKSDDDTRSGNHGNTYKNQGNFSTSHVNTLKRFAAGDSGRIFLVPSQPGVGRHQRDGLQPLGFTFDFQPTQPKQTKKDNLMFDLKIKQLNEHKQLLSNQVSNHAGCAKFNVEQSEKIGISMKQQEKSRCFDTFRQDRHGERYSKKDRLDNTVTGQQELCDEGYCAEPASPLQEEFRPQSCCMTDNTEKVLGAGEAGVYAHLQPVPKKSLQL